MSTHATHAQDSTGQSTTTDDVHDGLTTIVAQTVQFETLPDWDIYHMACDAVQDSIEDAAAEEIDR